MFHYFTLYLQEKRYVHFNYNFRYLALSLLQKENVRFYCIRLFCFIFAPKNVHFYSIYRYFALSLLKRKNVRFYIAIIILSSFGTEKNMYAFIVKVCFFYFTFVTQKVVFYFIYRYFVFFATEKENTILLHVP